MYCLPKFAISAYEILGSSRISRNAGRGSSTSHGTESTDASTANTQFIVYEQHARTHEWVQLGAAGKSERANARGGGRTLAAHGLRCKKQVAHLVRHVQLVCSIGPLRRVGDDGG